jgi:hypothetical protein
MAFVLLHISNSVKECITIKQTDVRSRKRKFLAGGWNITILTIFLEGRPTMFEGERRINGRHPM